MLPEIVAELARWRLQTWPNMEAVEALLFMAATQEAGSASAQMEATFRDLKASDAVSWVLGGYLRLFRLFVQCYKV